MKVRFKKLNPQAATPKRAHDTDAGFDLTAVSKAFDRAHGCIIYGTGIAVEIPSGHMGLVFPRSSIADHAQHLTNSVGVIDAGYRGEIKAKFCPTVAPIIAEQGQGAEMYYNVGERIAQLIILPIPDIEFEEVDELSTSDRGIGGYGSTGK